MIITVNGKERKIGPDYTLKQLLTDTFKKPKGIIVLLNNDIVKGDRQQETFLRARDRVEFIQMIGGG
jgi:thiamine biosynthesis protein ThiS